MGERKVSNFIFANVVFTNVLTRMDEEKWKPIE